MGVQQLHNLDWVPRRRRDGGSDNSAKVDAAFVFVSVVVVVVVVTAKATTTFHNVILANALLRACVRACVRDSGLYYLKDEERQELFFFLSATGFISSWQRLLFRSEM